MMNQNNKTPRDQEHIKLFLHTEAIAILITSLSALRSELALADEQIRELQAPEIKMRIPDNLFQSLDPIIESISTSVMEQSERYFDENKDLEGKQIFHSTIHERWQWHSQLIELMQLVLAAAYRKNE